MIIDFHTHVFPDKIVHKALGVLSDNSGGLEPQYDGTVDGLIKRMETDGVDISVVMNIATNAHQMRSVNDFACSVNNYKQKIISFGSVYPDAPDALEELERLKEMGLKGVKFHPEYQNFYVDDEKMRPIYKKIGELGLITLFHAGGDLGFAPPYHCMPENAANALKMFDSPVVFAHWGGYMAGEQVLKYLCGTDAYFDLSFGYGSVPKLTAKNIIEKHGTEKLLFGSDGPWHSPSMEYRLLNSLGLTEDEKSAIYSENALRLLDLN